MGINKLPNGVLHCSIKNPQEVCSSSLQPCVLVQPASGLPAKFPKLAHQHCYTNTRDIQRRLHFRRWDCCSSCAALVDVECSGKCTPSSIHQKQLNRCACGALFQLASLLYCVKMHIHHINYQMNYN